MRIIRFLLNIVVFLAAMAVFAEYFQWINLHPKFPPSEKQEVEEEYDHELDDNTVIEEIPNIESNDVRVKDVSKEQTTLLKTAPTYAKEDILPFGLRFNGIDSYFNVFGVYLLPEEVFSFEVIADKQFEMQVVASKGQLTETGKQTWKWIAPKTPGLYTLILTAVGLSESMKINCFVMTPIPPGNEEIVIQNFKIGIYPPTNSEDNAAPKGFIEVNKSNEKAHVSPNFQMSEFLSNQAEKWKYPNYVYLDEQLLVKLELLLAAVNQSGIQCDKFAVLSGYRTPHYNKLKDNKEYSSHQFGKATDIYIDKDGDGWMDDLNGDGKRSSEDAKVLYDLIDSFQKQSWYKPFIGGMGFYEQNASRTSFVHIDVRTQKIPIRW